MVRCAAAERPRKGQDGSSASDGDIYTRRPTEFTRKTVRMQASPPISCAGGMSAKGTSRVSI